ncbi:cell division protein FtsA [Companilactobacillus metriopterae]|uniref:cell division protein FtsA n=1 Tax=Companilactobacillus metriopterae TaxID=1909267 RepID=UPI00100BD110|nr:cell division protein FtsA [Companilactobacillus metriopterae]
MDDSKFFVGLDIGTNAIKVVVGEAIGDKLNVVGVGSERSEGVSKGVIVDIDKASGAIQKAVKKAETQANITIKDVVLGISPNMIQIEQCQGMLAIDSESREINENDVRQVMSSAMTQNLPSEREVVSLVPSSFSVDGFKDIKDPRGMIGVRLEMDGITYTAPKTIIHNAKKAVEQAGLNIKHKVIAPMALSKVVLNSGESDFGAIIVDMGAGQTSASVIHDRKLKLSTTDFEGGDLITHDISVVLNTTIENASQLKLYYGNADSLEASLDPNISVDVVGETTPQNISEKDLAEIIEARIAQIFDRIKAPLETSGALSLPGGIVLTGGVAATPNIEKLASEIFGVKVRSYVPAQMGMRYPSYSLGLGLVTYAAALSEVGFIADNVVNGAVVSNIDVRVRQNEPEQQPKKMETPKKQPTKKSATKEKKSSEKKSDSRDRLSGLKDFWSKFFD